MKKQLAIVSLLSVAAVSMLATSANAAEVSNETTDAEISFNTGKGTDPGKGPFKDNLSLVFKPSTFQFGKQDATAGISTFYNTVTDPKKQYLVVNDDRPLDPTTKNLSKWTLTAKLSAMTTGTEKEGLNAKLSYTLGAATEYKIGETMTTNGDDYIPNDPETNSTEALGGPLNVGTEKLKFGDGTSSTVTLEAGASSTTDVIAKTDVTTKKVGVASKVDNVKLIVTNAEKSGAAGKTYKGTVTWSLDDAPK
ncbi:WxL domain-containing protein [Enterococcus ureasiticus]|uniref:WxL domain-containing protein n=1 Tax=Enterococcus ureasiticus TaxID=903984 RepID=A0A1E5GJ78_9ENTE|nr:WxL domain-containing protein [Enterococcus ureasiticus]OEG12776.1 hypothetical protein BCR21_16480 [Enterococcus ureasiticus]